VSLVRRLAAGGAAIAVVAGVAIGFRMNPTAPPASPADPTELLQNGSFEQPVAASAWNLPAGSPPGRFRIVDDTTAVDLRRIGRLTATKISQEVLLTPVRGRAYRFAVFVRRAPGSDGTPLALLQAQTACAADEEIAGTPVPVPDSWTEVSATIAPVNGERCTMRVSLVVSGGIVDVDRARFGDAGLINPSFELGDGRESWTVDVGANAELTDGGAVDGLRSLRVTADRAGVGIRQDALIDPSSEPLLATASVLVRAPIGPAEVELSYRQPCSSTIDRVKVAAGPQWQRVTVRQTRLPGEAAPPSLIKVDGRGCAGQVAVTALAAGTIEIDGASLELQSYWPPEGDPSYRRAVAKKRAAVRAAEGSGSSR
jgi:hypothetical protein